MSRDIRALSDTRFDVLVVGGGIYGLCTAWDAALRGLSVAMIDRGDFAHATSFNTLRVIHGGLRYLQHGDLGRMRESIRERTTWMRIAPHLVHPLPFLVPTYGRGLRGRAALRLALGLHDLLGWDRNRLEDPAKHLPGSTLIPRGPCLEMLPGINPQGLTGAAVYYDCQMYSSERLAVGVLRAAQEAGAVAANYVEAEGPITQGNRVAGVSARDVLTGDALEIKANVVVNAGGPWAGKVLERLGRPTAAKGFPLSKAFNLLVARPLATSYAFGAYSRSQFSDRDAIVNKGSRMFFVTPWREGSLIGTAHLPYDGEPDNFHVTESEVEAFIAEINDAYPPAALRREDVLTVYGGLLPASSHGRSQLLKHYYLYDHTRDGVDGLITMVGVKFTESRHVAEKALDLVFRKLGKEPTPSQTAHSPVYGGQVGQFRTFLTQEVTQAPDWLGPEDVWDLVHLYGSAYREVLECAVPPPPGGRLQEQDVLCAQAVYAVRHEMAQKLSDVVFRRLGLSHPDSLTDATLMACGSVVAKELGWTVSRLETEIGEVRAALGNHVHAA